MRHGCALEADTLVQIINRSASFECTNVNGRFSTIRWCNLVSLFIKKHPNGTDEIVDSVFDFYETCEEQYRSDLRDSLKALIEASPEKAWNAISRKLIQDNYRFFIGSSDPFDSESWNPFALFSPDLIMNWIKDDPNNRAALVLHYLPSALYDENDRPTPTHEIFAAYDSLDNVQSEMLAITVSYSWTGKESNMLSSRITTYKHYRTLEKNSIVLHFIDEIIDTFSREREEARLREEREY